MRNAYERLTEKANMYSELRLSFPCYSVYILLALYELELFYKGWHAA